MSFSTITRRQSILELIDKRSKMSVAELSREFGVSGVTIRNDLDILENQGHLMKTYGGAIRLNGDHNLISLEPKKHVESDEKKKVAKLAAGLVQDGQCLFIASGTIATHLVPLIVKKRDLTILVNSLVLAFELSKLDRHRVFLLGGELRRGQTNTVGDLNASIFDRFCNIHIFAEADGIDPQTGVMTTDIELAQMLQALRPIATRAIICADRSAFSRRGHYRMFSLEDVDVLVTDCEPPTKYIHMCSNDKPQLLY